MLDEVPCGPLGDRLNLEGEVRVLLLDTDNLAASNGGTLDDRLSTEFG